MRLFQTTIIIVAFVLGACSGPKVEQIDLSGEWQVKFLMECFNLDYTFLKYK